MRDCSPFAIAAAAAAVVVVGAGVACYASSIRVCVVTAQSTHTPCIPTRARRLSEAGLLPPRSQAHGSNPFSVLGYLL